jgi:hypothetical protein
MGNIKQDAMPVIRDVRDFDQRSGNLLERLVFNYRPLFMLLMALATVVLGFMAVTRLELRPSFEKMIPQSQPYIQNFLENRQSLRGLGNSVRVVVENTQGDIFDPEYLDGAQAGQRPVVPHRRRRPRVDEVLWSPAVRWTEVTEQGFQGGPVMPDTYEGSPERSNSCARTSRAGIVGSLVASDFKSSMLIVPLLDKSAATGQRINYHAFSQMLEEQLRDKIEFAGDSAARKAGEEGKGHYKVRVIGFAKLMGDLIDGLIQVMMFFGLAVVTSLVIIYALHPLRAQHLAGGWLLADRGGLATGYRRLAGLCHRSVLGAGAVPDLRHRRVPRGAEDERHHAGHRPWHPQVDRRALHLPPSVHCRRHRAAGRCGGFRRADADRHSGDPGPGDHRQHRRRGADLHFAAADAGGAVLRRRRRQGRRARLENRHPRRPPQRLRQTVGYARPLHLAKWATGAVLVAR